MATSRRDASKAGKLLRNKRTAETVRSVAGSALSQTKKPRKLFNEPKKLFPDKGGKTLFKK